MCVLVVTVLTSLIHTHTHTHTHDHSHLTSSHSMICECACVFRCVFECETSSFVMRTNLFSSVSLCKSVSLAVSSS